MLTNSQTIHLLKNFYDSSNHILTEICLSRNEIQIAENNAYVNIENSKNVNMANFMKVSRGNHSPDKIAAKFQILATDFLKISLEDLHFLDGEQKLIVALTQEHIASNGSVSENLPIPHNMMTSLNTAGNDWTIWFPQEMSYRDAQDYFADNTKTLTDTLNLVEFVYKETDQDLRDIIIPNITSLLSDLGVSVK